MGLFHQEALRRGLPRLVADNWPTTAKLQAANAAWASTAPEGSSALLELGADALAFVHVGFGNAFAQVAGTSDETAKAAMDAVRELLPRARREREGRVPVRFWSYGPHGPMPMGRTLSVPSWEEIAANYPAETAGGLARLMSGDLPWRGGQLILWHGETGTGKTTALRALAREWSSWCEPHYITDPEKFFGNQSDYMLSVMLEHEMFPEDDEDGGEGFVSFPGAGMWPVPHFALVQIRAPGEQPESAPSWRLLILEDTGELLSADARMQAGQGLSRFLNVVDGLIGQGLRILVLVTTNEEIGRLHPAVARPGRCAANILFTRIPPEQANAWLAERDHDAPVSEPLTLAALYAMVEGWDAVTERQTTGFA
jgi:Domain of unknown function (DUF5925)